MTAPLCNESEGRPWTGLPLPYNFPPDEKRFLRNNPTLTAPISDRTQPLHTTAPAGKRLTVHLDIGQQSSLAAAPFVAEFDHARRIEIRGMLHLEGEALVMDRITAEEDGTDTALDRVLLQQLMEILDSREKKIVVMRYFRDKTQSEIAAYLGISQVQVSRLENRIMEKLRERALEKAQ